MIVKNFGPGVKITDIWKLNFFFFYQEDFLRNQTHQYKAKCSFSECIEDGKYLFASILLFFRQSEEVSPPDSEMNAGMQLTNSAAKKMKSGEQKCTLEFYYII